MLVVKLFAASTAVLCGGWPAQGMLFTGKQTKRAMHVRSIQVLVNSAWSKQDLKKTLSLHTLLHSLATHMFNCGNNIHVIRLLLQNGKDIPCARCANT